MSTLKHRLPPLSALWQASESYEELQQEQDGRVSVNDASRDDEKENGLASAAAARLCKRWCRSRYSCMILILCVGLGGLVLAVRLARIIKGTISDADEDVQARWKQWTVLDNSNSSNVAVVMLADNSAKFASFKQESIQDKRTYAQLHGYSFILCEKLLDTDRSPMWSKLRFIWNALQRYELVVWLDVDTIIWNKTFPVEHFTEGPSSGTPYDIFAQIDIHRTMESRYFNAGIMFWRSSAFSRRVLSEAYRKWQIDVLAGIWYFDADQDALNEVTVHEKDHVKLYPYGQLWQLGIHPIQKNSFIVHFPNCHSCSEDYLALYEATK